MEITDLTPAERRIRDAFPRGEGVDFREGPGEDAGDGHGWGPERTVRADVLAALLLAGPAAPGQVAELNVRGARITGKLNLKYADVEHAIRLRGCWFERKPSSTGPGCAPSPSPARRCRDSPPRRSVSTSPSG